MHLLFSGRGLRPTSGLIALSLQIGISPFVYKHTDQAAAPRRSTIQNMGVGHGRLPVVMDREFLHGENLIAVFEQIGGAKTPGNAIRG